MNEYNSKKPTVRFETIDLLVIGAIAALLGTTVFLLVFFPSCWPWYLWLLDMHVWPPWKCIGYLVALVESLVVIRLWPSKKPNRQNLNRSEQR